MTDFSNGWPARVVGLERRVDRLENLEPAVVNERVSNVEKDVSGLTEEVRSLKRALYTFSISVTLSALGFAFTVLLLLGNRR